MQPPNECLETKSLELDLGEAEAFARELAHAWAALLSEPDAAPENFSELKAAAANHPDPRIGWLSLAFETLCRQRSEWRASQAHWQEVKAAVDSVQQHGWPRASRLAGLAWANCLAGLPGRRAESIQMLRADIVSGAKGRPAVERAWACVSLCEVLTDAGQFEEAVSAGLQAEDLARQAQCGPLLTLAADHMVSAYLAVGDCDSALEVIARTSPKGRQDQAPQIGVAYHTILALLLQRQYTQALEWIERHPWLLEPQRMALHPRVGALVACVWAESGQADRASMLLASLRTGRPDDPLDQRLPRAWLTARALLSLGRPVEARQCVEEALADPAACVERFTPLVGAQLYEALSRACEAAGDLPAAMTALRSSQTYCAQWIGQNARARLHTLRMEAASLAPSEFVVGQRLEAIDRLVERATLGTQSPACPDPELPTVEPEKEPSANRRYVAQVVHELQSPVGGLVNMASFLLMSELDGRQRKWVELIQSSGHLLIELCNDLLDLAKVEANKLELRLQGTQAEQLVSEAMALMESMASAKGLSMQARLPASAPSVMLDRKRVMQVLLNLLSNAIKYTQTGEVQVRMAWVPPAACESAGNLRIEVHDTGPGLDANAKAKLFQEFVQLAGPDGETGPGTGLGLALCRALVHRMGGTLGVDSTPGKGSCFWFVLHPQIDHEAETDPRQLCLPI